MKTLLLICSFAIVIIATIIVAGQQRSATGAVALWNSPAGADSADWPTFGGDNTRTNANMAPTRITAANVGTMVRQQVTISAPIDAGLIYLRGVQVNGGSHDTFFGTTNLGRRVAIDANDGKLLWEFVPPGFDETTAMNPQRRASNRFGANRSRTRRRLRMPTGSSSTQLHRTAKSRRHPLQTEKQCGARP